MPADTPPAERALFWGLSEFLHLLHCAKGTTFSDVEKPRVVYAGKAVLLSYAELTRATKQAQLPLWPLKPKHHQ